MKHYPNTLFVNIHCRQHGAALIVSMMMLVAITLIGVAVMSNSRLEWLMAGNAFSQTSTHPRLGQTLSAAETQIRMLVCPTGWSTSPPTGCNPSNFNWADIDAFYSLPANNPPPDPSVAVAINDFPGPLPMNINNWFNGSFNSQPVTIFGNTFNRYVVRYLGCTYVPGTPTAPSCGAAGTTTAHTFEIWALSYDQADRKAAARLAQSTYVLLINRAGTDENTGGIEPPIPMFSNRFRRVGYVEIN